MCIVPHVHGPASVCVYVSTQEILDSASSVLISRGLLGLDVPVEKMVLVQKALVVACNLAGKPVIVSR